MQNLYYEKFLNHKNFISLSNNQKPDLVNNIDIAIKNLCSQIKNNKLDLANIINSKDNLLESYNIAQNFDNFEYVMLLAVGGSSLGGKSFSALNNKKRVIFLESIDPQTINNKLSEIDISKTGFLIISKSGETIETICQTLIIIEKMGNLKLDYKRQCFFVTQNKDSNIGKIAQNFDCKIYNHPNIGGRYSCLSLVGLVPALLANLDIAKINEGAKLVLNNFLLCQDGFRDACLAQLAFYYQGFTNNVLMPYIDILKDFNDWYRQLCAESLGKNNFGFTPINSMGTVDQHSQLQLYLEGIGNKFFTFIIHNQYQQDFTINNISGHSTIFDNKKLSHILRIEQDSTIKTLENKGLPIRTIEINQIDEFTLGMLMTKFMLEIIIMGFACNIDPFDQPAVELRKNIARSMISSIKS